MRFSAIIPVYNGAKYIKSLAADLQAQTCKDFEAIFINDGSTDDTPALLQEVQKGANFDMKIITQPNKGVSAARNAGIGAARGEYIIPVDVDDSIVSDFFATYRKAIAFDNADFYFAIDPDLPVHRLDNAKHTPIFTHIEKDNALHRYLYHTLVINSLCYSTRFLNDNRIRYAEGYKYCEDLHFVWQLLVHSQKNIQIAKKIFHYNNTPQSAMKKFNEDRIHAVTLMQQLEPVFQTLCPNFYPAYKRYAVARIAWSLLWQAASFCSYHDFKAFDTKHRLTAGLKSLILPVHEFKVSLSSLAALLCPPLFYIVARGIGKKRIFQV